MTPAWLADLLYWLPVLCPGLGACAWLLWSLRDGGWLYKLLTKDKDDGKDNH
jgi:hypothetical protein